MAICLPVFSGRSELLAVFVEVDSVRSVEGEEIVDVLESVGSADAAVLPDVGEIEGERDGIGDMGPAHAVTKFSHVENKYLTNLTQ